MKDRLTKGPNSREWEPSVRKFVLVNTSIGTMERTCGRVPETSCTTTCPALSDGGHLAARCYKKKSF